MIQKIKKPLKIFTLTACLLILSLIAIFAAVYHQVSKDTSERIERGAINRVIFSESPVYYDDGEHIIGVFFEKTHRKYIQYKDIPPIFIKALIASEDQNFFNHPGFDAKGILRAVIANTRAGKVVQGGSTITQQTAKNIFRRERRSYRAKIKELFQAILLERKYSKEEILEMYINQFFVTGFGRGLKIASQYFFDKDTTALNLEEAAFIAGSVKGPYQYNPFIKKTEAEKVVALRRAKTRKDHVLNNMYKMKLITELQYSEAKSREVPFKEGKVTYRLNVILDYVRQQLESDFFRKILQEQGVDNIATSGIRIHTSINREIQEGALKSIRYRLPRIDVKLSGYDESPLLESYPEFEGKPLKKQKNGLPFLCRITHINRDPDNPYLMVSWEDGGGIIEYDGFRSMGESWLKGKLGEWAVFEKKHAPDFLMHLRMDQLVPVTIHGGNGGNVQSRLFLSKIPDLEGAVIVLREGMIKAMVGGFSNRFFNRAADARRQLGSIFKPLIYTAALQLKWNSLDPLSNKQDLFPFETTNYLPKPDHKPETDRVSMAWAGVKSENLATIWLLYHLSDRLNMREFRHLVDMLGLNQTENESYEDYVERIRDEHGIVVNENTMMEAAFEEAKKFIEPDLIFGGYEKLIQNLRRIHYRIDLDALNLSDEESSQIYRFNFQRLKSFNIDMKAKLEALRQISGRDLATSFASFQYRENRNRPPRIVYRDPHDSRNLDFPPPVSQGSLSDWLEGTQGSEIWIDDLIPSKHIDLLQFHMKDIYKRMQNHKKYAPDLLYKIRDFRTLVNLHFAIMLSQKMGITSKLDPVLSFPLGANSISILEAALAYQTIMTGHTHPFAEKIANDSVPVIRKIQDRDGETIWAFEPKPRHILSKRVSGQVTELLKLVVTHGTGRKAKDAVRLSFDVGDEKILVPVRSFGKTGTANQYRNSSFVGFIPGPEDDTGRLGLREGYVIASYVGYDDNRPMKGKHVTVYGASGALPIWIDTAKDIVNSHDYKKNLQVADFAFDNHSGVPDDKEMRPVYVSPRSGLPTASPLEKVDRDDPCINAYAEPEDNGLRLWRTFEPLQGANNE